VSFILDALKKLEREKQAREPGVVVVGPVPWGGADRGGGRRKLVLSGVALAAIVGGTGWWLASGSRFDAGAKPLPTSSTKAGPKAAPVAATQQASPVQREPSTAPRRAAATAPAPAPRRLGLPGNETVVPRAGAPEPTVSEEGAPPPVETAVVVEDVPPASPVVDDPEDAEFRLSAISTRDGEPVAILNDRLVREGDAFDRIRILRIGPTEIEIEVDGERRTIGF
jgi:hypothetical protein